MYRPRRWQLNPHNPAAEDLSHRLRVSPIVAQVLLNRGFSDPDSARAFLQPSLNDLADPDLLPGLPAAAQRIAKAIADQEKIVVYGDYDVDGITAVSILWHAITLLGGNVSTYIPHRIDEGYGVNADALNQIIDAGAKLIITVDCGITALAPASLAKDRAVDLIITDHHHWHGDPPQLPDCHSIVHPRLLHPNAHGAAVGNSNPNPYPNPHLCGAGVAFKLAWGIGKAAVGAARVSESFRAFLLEATALAALGTIADVVPLVGENRVLAHFGLTILTSSKLHGIRALIDSAGLYGKNLDTYDVGFLLAPRLNACGRLGHAALAVEMLTTAPEPKAREIAAYLESQNRARQTVEKQILDQALAQIEANNWAHDRHRALVLAAPGWHGGVIGIVASRIVDRFCRPAILIAVSDSHGQGSARSIPGFHLAHALESCAQHLLAHGGHEMAAGLKIDPARIDDFRADFCACASQKISDEMLIPTLRIEAAAELPQITEALVSELQRLGPFGHGNRRPTLCISSAELAAAPRRVGKTGDHLQLTVRQNRATMRCIAFGAGDICDKLTPGAPIRLAVEPSINEFNGRRSVELEVKDFQLPPSPVAAPPLPVASEIAPVQLPI